MALGAGQGEGGLLGLVGVGVDPAAVAQEDLERRKGCDVDVSTYTMRGILSVARFCYVFPCELGGPAWAVGSYSVSQSAGGTSQNMIFKTLRQIGRPALWCNLVIIR